MGIKTKNCEEYTQLREGFGRAMVLPLPITSTNNISTAAAVPGTGSNVTLVQQTLIPTTIHINLASSTGTLSLLFVGFNQFGEPVSETVSLGSTVVDGVTLHCYSYLTSVTVTAQTAALGNLILGQNHNHATVRGSLGLPIKCASTDIAYVCFQGVAAAAATFTGSPYYKIQIPQITGTTHSVMHVILTKSAWLKF